MTNKTQLFWGGGGNDLMIDLLCGSYGDESEKQVFYNSDVGPDVVIKIE